MTKDDVLEGMTAVVTVRLAEPQFEGQTKEVLGTPAASADRRQDRRGRAEAHSSPRPRRPRSRRPAPCWRRSSTPRAHGSPRVSSATPSGARTPSSRVRCRPSSPTVVATTSTAASCSSSRETPRSARPSWPATRSTRRCCRSAARSSTRRRSRRVRCCRTPSARRSSRSSAQAAAGPSISTRPATARSSSWPTPTPTAPTSGVCWRRCSTSTCVRC